MFVVRSCPIVEVSERRDLTVHIFIFLVLFSCTFGRAPVESSPPTIQITQSLG